MMTIKSILLSIGCIILGCFFLWNTYKHPVRKEYDFTEANVKGYIGGITLIIVGILTLIKGHW